MKGFLRTMEAAIAGIIILSFLAFLSMGAPGNVQGPGLRGYQALESLDARGLLRGPALQGDYSGINGLVAIPGYNHSIELCSAPDDCLGERPEGGDVWVADYMISGKDTYGPRDIRLYMWLA